MSDSATSEKRPLLSIIIPAYNEERRLQLSLPKIHTFLETQPYEAEVIVVENGSTDHTAAIVEQFAKQFPYIRLLQVTTRGKGLAVKQGMLAARGTYRFMCDADLSMPIEELEKFMPPQLEGYEVVIGSREAPGSRRVNEPEYRHMIGRISNFIIKVMALRGYEDTQCGFKLFTQEAAEDLFTVQRTNGIGFDVELIYIADKRGYKVYEMPVTWYFDPESKMRLIDDSLKMIGELWEIRRNWRKGLYERQSAPRESTIATEEG